MSAAQKLKLSPQQYLTQERAAEFRSEHFRGEVFAMAGASYAHILITTNFASEMRQQLKLGPCRVLTNEMRVKVETNGLYTYPDISVVFEEPKFEDEVFDTLLNPRVIVEVLSDSTDKYDRGDKFRYYRSIPSFKEYVLVSQKEPLVETYVRQPDDSWLLTTYTGLEAVLGFQTIEARVPVTEIYAGVKFTAAIE